MNERFYYCLHSKQAVLSDLSVGGYLPHTAVTL